ncbi:MAG: hypothetical protein U9Q77_09800 [Candidatus Marinimicrobia bacterium]|nr:hypothetical protein [Candidatus Neomarinimicrobiota bacterium]
MALRGQYDRFLSRVCQKDMLGNSSALVTTQNAPKISNLVNQRSGERSLLAPVLNILIVFVFLLTTPQFVQGSDQDSLAYVFRQDNLSTNNDLQLNYKIGLDRSTLLISDVIRYKVFAYKNSITQGEQFSIEHRLRSDWSWGADRRKSLRLESNQYQDHRTGLASTINNWALLGGVKRDDRFSLFLGGRSIERYGIVDRGWTTALDMQNAWQFGSQRSAINMSGFRDQLSEHLSHSINMQADYLIHFGKISTFKTSLQREARRQSFYTDSLGSSQSRNNESLLWQNNFVYHLGQNLQLYHSLNWSDQLTEIDQEKVDLINTIKLSGEERKRFSLVNETGVKLQRPRFSTLTAFKVESSQNKYYVDYTQSLYQLREEVLWQVSGWVDSLSSRSTLSRLEYNTPDTTNDDDRDEWRFNTELNLVWHPSPFYQLDLGAKLGLFHLIYLFNTRSSENHWNRNLVLWSGFEWCRQSWQGTGRAQIRSNYFDYDYDDLFVEFDQPTRSFVHRSLDLQKRLIYSFDSHWSFSAKLAARWEDEGQLDWDIFVQQVSSDREQFELIIKLFYDYRGWKGWIGYLTHERSTRYTLKTRKPELWHGAGPLLGVRYRLGNRLSLDSDFRFISVKDQDREYLLPKVYLTLVYR